VPQDGIVLVPLGNTGYRTMFGTYSRAPDDTRQGSLLHSRAADGVIQPGESKKTPLPGPASPSRPRSTASMMPGMADKQQNRGGPLYWLKRRSRRVWIVSAAVLPVMYVATFREGHPPFRG
jgi:hypothetical protein